MESERSEDRVTKAYHHGDLRQALIDTTYQLLTQIPVEQFTVADAARAAGVSSGAPYRHFKDKDELLAHVAALGFDELSARMASAMAGHPVGSIDRTIACGCSYVEFSAQRPEAFHLMWGATRPHSSSGVARTSGEKCYRAFIENLAETMAAHGLGDRDPRAFGAPLWALVHGYAALLVGRNEMLNPDMDTIRGRIAAVTRAYFEGESASS